MRRRIKMTKIYTIKDYNAKAYSKYLVAVNKSVKDYYNNLGGIPAKSHYMFDKTTGYVVVGDNSAKWFSNKERANEYLIKIKKEQTNE
jgi:hypothetical protein